jgi:biopolymer transport protein ExbD
MQVQADNQPYDDINVTPMLDLAYVLLVIFIIMTTASVQGVRVEAPKAKTTGNLAGKRVKAVTVSQAGDLYLDAYPVTPEQLEERLLQLHQP